MSKHGDKEKKVVIRLEPHEEETKDVSEEDKAAPHEERREAFARNRSKSEAVLRHKHIDIKVHEGVSPDLSTREQQLILKHENILDMMQHGKPAQAIPTITHINIDKQHQAILLAILDATHSKYKGSDALKFAKAAEKVITKMDQKGELGVSIPKGLDPELEAGLERFLHDSFVEKFINHKGRTATIGVFEDRPTQLSTRAVDNLETAKQSIRSAQSIVGEYPVINNLDILQQSYTLGAHSSIEDAQDRQKYFNRIGELANAIVEEFKKKFGPDYGPQLADRVWRLYPFAITNSDQAEALVKNMKTGESIEDTLQINAEVLSVFSIQNLIPLKSMLHTDGMSAGFLHRTETIQTTEGTKTLNKVMTILDVQRLQIEVEDIIKNGGRTTQIEKPSIIIPFELGEETEENKTHDEGYSPKKIHGKHSKKAVEEKSKLNRQESFEKS